MFSLEKPSANASLAKANAEVALPCPSDRRLSVVTGLSNAEESLKRVKSKHRISRHAVSLSFDWTQDIIERQNTLETAFTS